MRDNFVILSREDGDGSPPHRSFAPLRMTAFALLALATACAHQTERRYTMMLGANRAGTQVTHIDGGRRIIDFEVNDRGRGPRTTSEIRINDHFIPTFEKTTGV